jgi:nucleoside-diphosphate-sugar epimerase
VQVLVTGAAGFIGSHLCERLLASGHEVVGVDAFTSYYARELKELNVAGLRRLAGFSLLERDVTRLRAGDLEGVDAIFHLAGRPGVRRGAASVYEAANVRATDALARAAARAGVRRLLLASSSSVYGGREGPVAEDAVPRPLSPYGRSKLRAERAAARVADRHGLELVTLRYFTVYGPRQRPDMAFARFLSCASTGAEMPLIGGGRQLRDFTYVGDAVEASAMALERGRAGAAYNVAGGRPVSLCAALELLSRALGQATRTFSAPADPREPPATHADLSRAREELGWEPAVPLERGLALQAARAAARAA